VGGTFTDVTLSDPATQRIVPAKVLTTPNDRAIGVSEGISAALAAANLGAETVREVIHGSTTGTNALIERTGARVGFLTTAGFRDMLEIGRIQRPPEGLYDIRIDRPPPLVPRALCRSARERISGDGTILVPLDEQSVHEAIDVFARERVEAIAICFLNSFTNPAHEMAAARICAARLPGLHISVSSRISPEYREYERASTAVINAYLTPVMAAYLANLETKLRTMLGPAQLFVVQANGGSTSIHAARERAVTTVNSGPAGGVVAAAYYGRRHRRDRLVSVDMGGTSFDIGLIEGGESKVTTEGAFQGLPVKIPIVDLHIIGAGGGSIAWIDRGGALNVGPRSAGAEPGPACYGRGGTEPTVTDANLVLGRLNPDYFNGGRMRLDVSAAHRAVAAIASRLKLPIEEAALGIVRVVNANMVKGIAAVTIQRGIDARDFSLLSFGGAAGVHAVDLARDLEMREVIVPPYPGTFSAVGLLVTEVRHDYVAAAGGISIAAADPTALEQHYRRMELEAAAELGRQGFQPDAVRLVRSIDLKVSGQTYELSLPLPSSDGVDKRALDAVIAAFAALYRERYAFFFEGEPIEIINLRVAAFGEHAQFDLPTFASGDSAGIESARKSRRGVYFEGLGVVETAIYERERLKPGMEVAGPAVIEEEMSATLLPPGLAAAVLADLGLAVSLRAEADGVAS
jgi:N-methylhydantoinase A